jgi:hypothetical protein
MLEKLESTEQRYIQVEEELALPDTFSNNEKYIIFTTTELGSVDLAVAVVDEVVPFTE